MPLNGLVRGRRIMIDKAIAVYLLFTNTSRSWKQNRFIYVLNFM